MLKRFTVENFSSYKKENSLDLTAGRTELNSAHAVSFKKVKILKSAVIYGANASGKSNLVKAIEYSKNVVLKGLDNVDTYKKYFRLSKGSAEKASAFEYELEIDNKFYSYGFNLTLSHGKVDEEWLYRVDKAKPEKIFERKENKITLGRQLNEDSIKGRFEIYSDDMANQNSQLFLSEIAGKGLNFKEVQIINDIYNWFRDKLLIIYPNTTFEGIPSLCKNKDLSALFRNYLKVFDTGIIGIETIEEDFEKCFEGFPDELKKDIERSIFSSKKNVTASIKTPNELLTVYKSDSNELKVQKLGLLHNKELNEVFELKDESDGTRRLFDLIPLIAKFSQDYTIIIDEFDRSLHPKLTKNFFTLFYKLNTSKTQLIITTHESTLLDLELLRRDEIWFAEKDSNGASKLFSLNQFKVRYDSKVEKAYLLGRYGAIPIFKTFNAMNEDC